jgi:hypothetical protein
MTPRETELLAQCVAVYEESDAPRTVAFYKRLEGLGQAGALTMNLFRACKNSERAKLYRGGGHCRAAYDRKGWALDHVAAVLIDHAAAAGIASWGWQRDPAQEVHCWVLYVDLPTGQVSFHAADRGAGPDYPGVWDGRPHSAANVIRWCARLLAAAERPEGFAV